MKINGTRVDKAVIKKVNEVLLNTRTRRPDLNFMSDDQLKETIIMWMLLRPQCDSASDLFEALEADINHNKYYDKANLYPK